jgi:hypothetical protein
MTSRHSEDSNPWSWHDNFQHCTLDRQFAFNCLNFLRIKHIKSVKARRHS